MDVTTEAAQNPGAGLLTTSERISRADCWGLLATGQVGRVGLLVQGRPEILPVNYVLDGETILYRTAGSTVLNRASLSIVAFEVDRVEEAAHIGWSVLVQGIAQDIGDAVDPTSERLKRLPLVSWAPGARARWFRIDPSRVSGRRLRSVADAL